MTRFTRIAGAALFGLGFASTAALAEGPRVVGTGENASVVYDEPSANIVGGALTRVVGSGESSRTEVIAVETVQPGRLILGSRTSGDNQDAIYQDGAPALRLAQGGVRG